MTSWVIGPDGESGPAAWSPAKEDCKGGVTKGPYFLQPLLAERKRGRQLGIREQEGKGDAILNV